MLAANRELGKESAKGEPTIESSILRATCEWLERFVIAYDICPFAGREFRRGAIRYAIAESGELEDCLHELAAECRRLDEQPSIATTLLILPRGMENFDDYLELLSLAEALLESLDYRGVYQLASFHPDYVFDGVAEEDPANHTNRSPYPMLHLLREAELERALRHHPDPSGIPERNIVLLRDSDSHALAEAKAFIRPA